ncbi:MAG TPA: sulfite exporter TauE/SafE family protein [Terriglobia bacterium]|nr:sulfite exporter TauE/SafE family protein [Terriglobia bacterium]
MSTSLILVLMALGSFATGVVGALTGLGGGIILVPMLVLIFHIHMRYAAGASLIAVIATSSGAAAAFLSEGYTNLRVGMFLQLTSIGGGIAGAFLLTLVPVPALMTVFGLVLLYSGYLSFRRKEEAEEGRPSDPLAVRLHMEGSYPAAGGWEPYKVFRVIPSFLLMGVAGIISGLLGIGAGAVNVLAMDQVMRLPYKVSTSTSNFMIGITAAASAGIYLHHGYIDPVLAMPVMLGVFGGAVVGARLLMFLRAKPLRIFFSVVVLVMAIEMIYKGLAQW